MKTTFLLILSCLFAITSFTQDSTLQLNDYKYRISGYRALTFSTSLNGSLSHRSTTNIDSSKNNQFNLYPTSLSYNRIVSTDRKQSWSSVYLNSYYSFMAGDSTSKSSSGNNNLQWKFDNRYFRKNNWFWQLGNDAYLRGTFDKESFSSFKQHQYNATDALTLGFGKGRVEIVRDAQMALYILKDLKTEGLIDHEVDSATIYEFARLVTEINNKRLFDSRRKRIYELTQIDSFLRRNGISAATDIRYFSIINDDWSFAYNPMRFSGKDWFFHLVPEAQFGKYKWSNDSHSGSNIDVTNYSLMPEIGFDSYKPLSLQWQSDFYSTISWARTSYNSKRTEYYNGGSPFETKTTEKFDQARLAVFYGLGYYPNTRTSVNTTFSVEASYSTYKDNYTKDELSLRPTFLFSGNYFISFRTRLTADVSFDYQYDHLKWVAGGSREARQFNLNFNFGLTHAFL